MRRINDSEIEKKAIFFNILSLLFCLLAISINYITIITVFVAVLSVIELGHIIWGDVTQSYKLLRKRFFLYLYQTTLVIKFLLVIVILLILEHGRIYFISIFAAFLSDFLSNKTRTKKKTNRVSGLLRIKK